MPTSPPRTETLLKTIRLLAVDIGPRGATTHNERRAALHIAEHLYSLGYKVTFEHFYSVTSFSWAYGSFLLALIIAALLVAKGTTSILPVILSVCALLGLVFESSGIETLTTMLPQWESQNVVARLPSAGIPKRCIVVTAHLDSARSALFWHPRIVRFFRPLLLIVIFSVLAVTPLALLSLFFDTLVVRFLALIFGMYLLLILLLLIERETRHHITCGANDNASGVAVLLALAASLREQPVPVENELWLVATTCKEAGMVGMQHFMQRHGAELSGKNTVFINIDQVGAGHVAYTTAEGVLFPLRTDAALVHAAHEFQLAHPNCSLSGKVYHTLTTDAFIPLIRGRRAISIMAFDDHGQLPNWHWRTDTIEHIDLCTVQVAYELADFLVRSATEKQNVV